MSDLVERLRSGGTPQKDGVMMTWERQCAEAADRIEALDAALAKADDLALQVEGPHIWMEKVHSAAAAYRQARDATR